MSVSLLPFIQVYKAITLPSPTKISQSPTPANFSFSKSIKSISFNFYFFQYSMHTDAPRIVLRCNFAFVCPSCKKFIYHYFQDQVSFSHYRLSVYSYVLSLTLYQSIFCCNKVPEIRDIAKKKRFVQIQFGRGKTRPQWLPLLIFW